MVQQCVDKAFDLFVDLGASDEQCDFPIVYACARQGWCTSNYDQIPGLIADNSQGSMAPLYNLILELPAPRIGNSDKLAMMVTNIAYSDYLGSWHLAVSCPGRIQMGQLRFATG